MSGKPFLAPWWSIYSLIVLGLPSYLLWTEDREKKIFFPETNQPQEVYSTYELVPVDSKGLIEGIPIPPFALTDQNNQPFPTEKLYGKPAIVDFIFTRCPSICPTLTMSVRSLQEKIPAEQANFISITVDPDYDTPEVLKSYAEKYNADLASWSFLTGEPNHIRDTIRNFQQALEVGAPDEAGIPDIKHSQKLLLVDATGKIRGFFDSDEAGRNSIIQALNSL